MVVALLLGGGKGERIHQETPKQFIKIKDKPLYQYSLNTFLMMDEIDQVVLVLPSLYIEKVKKEITNPKLSFVKGGFTRGESSYLGLLSLKNQLHPDDIILIHDVARPLVSKEIILNNIQMIKKYGACTTILPLEDSLLKGDQEVLYEISRENLYLVQTPQGFKYQDILDAYEKEKEQGLNLSDDVQVALKHHMKVYLVMGSRYNFKVTHDEDIQYLNKLIS